MRHSARFPITAESINHLVGLTEEGVRMAEALGAVLAPQFVLGRLRSSPVGRCIDTANGIARGAGWRAQSQIEPWLDHTFVADAWDKVNNGQVNGNPPPEVRRLLEHALGEPGTPRLDVLVTHDTVLGTVIAHLLGLPMAAHSEWPKFLEGMLVWRDGEKIYTRWRCIERVLPVDHLAH